MELSTLSQQIRSSIDQLRDEDGKLFSYFNLGTGGMRETKWNELARALDRACILAMGEYLPVEESRKAVIGLVGEILDRDLAGVDEVHDAELLEILSVMGREKNRVVIARWLKERGYVSDQPGVSRGRALSGREADTRVAPSKC